MTSRRAIFELSVHSRLARVRDQTADPRRLVRPVQEVILRWPHVEQEAGQGHPLATNLRDPASSVRFQATRSRARPAGLGRKAPFTPLPPHASQFIQDAQTSAIRGATPIRDAAAAHSAWCRPGPIGLRRLARRPSRGRPRRHRAGAPRRPEALCARPRRSAHH